MLKGFLAHIKNDDTDSDSVYERRINRGKFQKNLKLSGKLDYPESKGKRIK